MASYNPFPTYPPASSEVTEGVAAAITADIADRDSVVIGVDGPMVQDWAGLVDTIERELRNQFQQVRTMDTRTLFIDWDELQAATLTPQLVDDPDFAKLPDVSLADLMNMPACTASNGEALLIYGPGAAFVEPDVLWYADTPKRYAEAAVVEGEGRNLGQPLDDANAPTTKRLFYIDWPLLDRHRDAIALDIDRFIDAQPSVSGDDSYPSISGDSLRQTFAELAKQPFRTRPTFNTTSWGGHWAQQELGMNTAASNTALGYELIAPESGLLIGDVALAVEVPFALMVSLLPSEVLGVAVHDQFGTSFPIRFDYLDTVAGGNLSVHCHPQLDYMQEVFGWPYTQHETYYMMVGGPDRKVFLGLRDHVDLEAFHKEAHDAHHAGVTFDIEKYVQTFPADQHQLFVIPAGTPHGSGEGNVVLEVSATPYLYSLRFFDWLRRDSEGKQRPVHVEKAFANLNTNRQGQQVVDDLVQHPRALRENGGFTEEMLGELPEMFFEVRRLVLDSDETTVEQTTDRFHVFNVVEGDGVEVSWADGTHTFAYAETFVVPAAVADYSIRRLGNDRVRLVKALVR